MFCFWVFEFCSLHFCFASVTIFLISSSEAPAALILAAFSSTFALNAFSSMVPPLLPALNCSIFFLVSRMNALISSSEAPAAFI
jgi:hypothetical protein